MPSIKEKKAAGFLGDQEFDANFGAENDFCKNCMNGLHKENSRNVPDLSDRSVLLNQRSARISSPLRET